MPLTRAALVISALLALGVLATAVPARAESRYFSFGSSQDSVPYLYRRSYGTSFDSIAKRTSSKSAARCARNRSLLALFPRDRLDCSGGWTFPGLIDGDCPIAACVLKTRESGRSPFGSVSR